MRMLFLVVSIVAGIMGCNEMPECRHGRVRKLEKVSECSALYQVCTRGKWNPETDQSPDFESGAECEVDSAKYQDCPSGKYQICQSNCRWSECVAWQPLKDCEDVIAEWKRIERQRNGE